MDAKANLCSPKQIFIHCLPCKSFWHFWAHAFPINSYRCIYFKPSHLRTSDLHHCFDSEPQRALLHPLTLHDRGKADVVEHGGVETFSGVLAWTWKWIYTATGTEKYFLKNKKVMLWDVWGKVWILCPNVGKRIFEVCLLIERKPQQRSHICRLLYKASEFLFSILNFIFL